MAVGSESVTLRRVCDGGRVKRYVAAGTATALGVSLADLLSGKFVACWTCPFCGNKMAA